MVLMQAVAECFCRSGQAYEQVSANEMIQALDYFIVPDVIWPVGLLAARTTRGKYDAVVNRILIKIQADFTAMSTDPSHFLESKRYDLIGKGSAISCIDHVSYQWAGQTILFPTPEPLQQKLIWQCEIAFFTIQFNTAKRDRHGRPPWNFEISMPAL